MKALVEGFLKRLFISLWEFWSSNIFHSVHLPFNKFKPTTPDASLVFSMALFWPLTLFSEKIYVNKILLGNQTKNYSCPRKFSYLSHLQPNQVNHPPSKKKFTSAICYQIIYEIAGQDGEKKNLPTFLNIIDAREIMLKFFEYYLSGKLKEIFSLESLIKIKFSTMP